jgi:hypothetical protein
MYGVTQIAMCDVSKIERALRNACAGMSKIEHVSRNA